MIYDPYNNQNQHYIGYEYDIKSFIEYLSNLKINMDQMK